MQRRRPPLGFNLLGLILAGMGAGLALTGMWSGEGWLPRFLVGSVAALCFLAAEALWWMRPWLARAIDAWALTCPLAVIAAVVAVAMHNGASPGDLLLMIALTVCLVGVPCALVRGYVRRHAAVAGLGSARPPVPRLAP